MNKSLVKKIVLFLTITSFSVILAGCFSDDTEAETVLPEVNNTNCKPEVIASIEPKAAREKFAGLCAKRSGFKKSPEKSWTAW
jgi:entry exclusion lipoprotein TrbK